MSDEQEPTVQCVICGRNGLPPAECERCEGKAGIETRQFTLSEVRSGRAPDDRRYGTDGAVGPKIIRLPGSAGPGGQ